MTAPHAAPSTAPDPAALVATLGRVRAAVAQRVVGQEAVVEEVLLAMAAGGHALLVGVPGLAKTLLIRSVADAMALSFRRIQFTPDLVPSDITGTEILEEGAGGARAFRFVPGPVFASIVLADEINRAPPRTQAAMLEAMQEHSVTAAGTTMPLPAPFFVLATQNPIEQEGTYPLPEAQLDRFLFDIRVGYPSEGDEVAILRATTGRAMPPITPVLDGAALLAVQQAVRETPCSDLLLQYAARLVRASRPQEAGGPALVRQYVRWGAGPRAGQALVLGAKAAAFLAGRAAVAPADLRRVARPVLRHRILPNFAAEADGVTAESLIDALLAHVPPPASAPGA